MARATLWKSNSRQPQKEVTFCPLVSVDTFQPYRERPRRVQTTTAHISTTSTDCEQRQQGNIVNSDDKISLERKVIPKAKAIVVARENRMCFSFLRVHAKPADERCCIGYDKKNTVGALSSHYTFVIHISEFLEIKKKKIEQPGKLYLVVTHRAQAQATSERKLDPSAGSNCFISNR